MWSRPYHEMAPYLYIIMGFSSVSQKAWKYAFLFTWDMIVINQYTSGVPLVPALTL